MKTRAAIGWLVVVLLGNAAAGEQQTLKAHRTLAPRSLEGRVELDSFWVPLDETVWVTGDLELHCSGPLCIEGTLRVAPDRYGSDGYDGPDLWLSSDTRLVIPGQVLGGPGAPAFEGAASPVNMTWVGGDGSDVYLVAPEIALDGLVRAGDGGSSGPNALGGRGGSVDVRGECYRIGRELRTDADGMPLTQGLVAGAGGAHLGASQTHALPAGAGGPGGSVYEMPYGDPVETVEWDPARQIGMVLAVDSARGLSSKRSRTGQDHASLPQGQGRAGSSGVNRTGGPGGYGSAGAPGTVPSPAGQAGGHGGPGGAAAGSNGRSGGPGRDACPSGLGGQGGKGGTGGTGLGGAGGAGGAGGNGLFDPVLQTFIGPGGPGGHGGLGGDGLGGNGGVGGDGGRPGGLAGEGGDQGLGYPGPGGPGGHGGMGSMGPAPSGLTGPVGNSFPGMGGHTGILGGSCDQ
ncbi:MAG: hypothetical protein H6830_06500 [Planctomycetes bacterium]|nr:hypothetical protein [Planctomycetota bacterium]MCB9910955.1 hypothetical protein [Planctomycetota bacterium]MCB9911578.1 hypothetical protein [Planctomycetota bacterium]HPF14523.1 hypothetical protein [Planctomycetota bacterium]